MWVSIYCLAATSAVITWRTVHNRADATRFIGLYAVNGVLNVMWSALFFTLERPDWALVQVGFFWLSIVALIVFAWPRSQVAAVLLLPYVIWVTIAITLNVELVRLNGPFG
jgi:benzodiazapine receptor